MMPGSLYRFSAFSHNPAGGNPAGIWIGETLPPDDEMQQDSAEVGLSETIFIAPTSGPDRTVRYYSPEAEITFCGHATIAAGVVLGTIEGDATYRLSTLVGVVPVAVHIRDGVREAIAALGWERGELDAAIPPAKVYAGAWHLILAVAESSRLVRLNYDFERLKSLMLREGLTTLQLVWRERSDVFHARNPFPVGGVVEDPATGAAAAALGGYLRAANLVSVPATLTIYQGETMGRPSQLTVDIPATGGIVVTGTAVRIDNQ